MSELSGLGAMPFGPSSGRLSRGDTMTIAQRFNAGYNAASGSQPPSGAAEIGVASSSAARGLTGLLDARPSVETLGYPRMSLRDKKARQPRTYSQKASVFFALLGGLLLWPLLAPAQSGIGDVVYTVGTVARDTNGQDWAYIVWQGTQTGLISNRVFAVYSKPGDPTNNVPYTRLSIINLQTDARVIEPLLRRAQRLGDDLNKLQQDLLQLFGSFMPSSAISPAEQLSVVIEGSLNNPNYYQNLLLLARNHAGIDLALGFADAELIAPGRTTFEVRAFDPVAVKDLAVIGRVGVDAGFPTILPPPGPPVLVPELSAMGDLNLKFRWGTPDILRRLGLMQFGYNLYRIDRDFALSNGWGVSTPPPLDLLSNLVAGAPSVAARVNRVPITPNKLFSLADAANLTPPGDTNTFFVMDDDGRGRPGYVNYGFTNGAQYLLLRRGA